MSETSYTHERRLLRECGVEEWNIGVREVPAVDYDWLMEMESEGLSKKGAVDSSSDSENPINDLIRDRIVLGRHCNIMTPPCSSVLYKKTPPRVSRVDPRRRPSSMAEAYEMQLEEKRQEIYKLSESFIESWAAAKDAADAAEREAAASERAATEVSEAREALALAVKNEEEARAAREAAEREEAAISLPILISEEEALKNELAALRRPSSGQYGVSMDEISRWNKTISDTRQALAETQREIARCRRIIR